MSISSCKLMSCISSAMEKMKLRKFKGIEIVISINLCYNNAILLKCICEGDVKMNLSEEIRRIRQRSFLTQEDFANKMDVAFSTVNRWEGGKSKPNMTAMKKIKEFCLKNNIEYSDVEEAWLDYKTETPNNG